MEFETKPEQPQLYYLLWCWESCVLIRASASALARESQAVVVREGCLGSREADWDHGRLTGQKAGSTGPFPLPWMSVDRS